MRETSTSANAQDKRTEEQDYHEANDMEEVSRVTSGLGNVPISA